MKDGHQYGIGGIGWAENVSYDNTESGMTATDVQGALDELNAGLFNMDLLWTNPNPSANFGAQTITFNHDGYSMVLIGYYYGVVSSNQIEMSQYVVNNSASKWLQICSTGNRTGGRSITLTATGATVGNAQYDGSQNNSYVIPIYIYGIK